MPLWSKPWIFLKNVHFFRSIGYSWKVSIGKAQLTI